MQKNVKDYRHGTRQINASLPAAEYDRIRAYMADRGLTPSVFIRRAYKLFLAVESGKIRLTREDK